MAYFGGLHFWWPKITGRLYPEMWARVAGLIIFAGFNLTFFPQYLLGYAGMPRRYHSYAPEYQVLHVLSSAGATILAVTQFVSITQQRLAGRLGLWIFLSTEILFFGPLFMAYFYLRLHMPQAVAVASRHTEFWSGTINTAVLLTASMCADLLSNRGKETSANVAHAGCG